MEKSHIERKLSYLYREHGLGETFRVNDLLMTFEKDVNGELNLYIYNQSEYDSYLLQLDTRSEHPIVVPSMDKYMVDKILGMVTKDLA